MRGQPDGPAKKEPPTLALRVQENQQQLMSISHTEDSDHVDNLVAVLEKHECMSPGFIMRR